MQATGSQSEEGFTLIEVLVSSMLLVLVLAIAGALIGSLSTTSRTVSSLTATTSSVQVAAESVERGIRNSSDFLLSVPTGTDQLLVARTAQSGTTLNWACSAWYYSSANGGSIRFKTSPTAITAPTASQLAQWTLLAKGVVPSSGTTIFSGSSPTLSFSIKSTSTGAGSATIKSTVLSRAGSSGTPACY
jgi:prepilin-type N-terminal cleavage/methylation domain-containing protein